jgi:type IV pilus assembly protein PilV
MKKHVRLDDKGFSIIEVMIGLTVFAIGILALAKVQIVSLKGNTNSRQMTEASFLAQSRMETLTRLPYASLVDDESGTLSSTGINADGREQLFVTGKPYQVSWNILNGNPVADMKMIRVIVNWQESGSQKTVTLDYAHADPNF